MAAFISALPPHTARSDAWKKAISLLQSPGFSDASPFLQRHKEKLHFTNIYYPINLILEVKKKFS